MPTSERARRRVVMAAVTTVAEHLGNTVTVARASYVDPRVVERFEQGRTILSGDGGPTEEARGGWIEPALRRAGAPDPSDDAGRAVLERAVARLLSSST